MERIESGAFFSTPPPRRETGKQGAGRKSKTVQQAFSGALSAMGAADAAGAADVAADDKVAAAADEAHALLDEVHQRGDELKREMSLKALERYKNAVRAFLKCVVEHGVGLFETSSGAQVGNRKRFTVVAVIDRKLERLAAGMMATQRDQLDILERVAEINGMLIDLLH